MKNHNNLEKAVWEVLRSFSDLEFLGQHALAEHQLISSLHWKGDTNNQRGFAVRAMLEWALQRLEKGNQFEQQSGETLRLRYLENMLVSACAAKLHVIEEAIYSRQRAGVKRVAKLFGLAAQTEEGGFVRKQLAVQQRYSACSIDGKTWLRAWSVFREPQSLQIAQTITNLALQPHLNDLDSLNWIVKLPNGRIQVNPMGVDFVRQLWDADERQEYNIIAAEMHEREQQFSDAIFHWQQADQEERAAMLLFTQRHTLSINEQQDLLDGFEWKQLNDSIIARLQLVRGEIAASNGDVDSALDAFEQVLRSPDLLIRAQGCHGMARNLQARDVNLALRYYQQSEKLLAQSEGDEARRLQVQVWIDAAWPLINQLRKYEQAREYLTQADAMLKDDWGDLAVDLYSAWGELHIREGNIDQCIEVRWQAWFKANEIQDSQRIIKIGFNLADNLAEAKRFGDAWRMMEKAAAAAEEAGDTRMVAHCKRGFGAFCILEREDAQAALPYYQDSAAYFQATNDQQWQGILCYDLAEAYVMLAQPEQAVQEIEKGQAFAKLLNDTRLEAGLQVLADSNPALSLDLSERQRKIVWDVVENDSISTKRCQELLKISRSTAGRIFQELVAQEVLIQEGEGRGVHYSLRQH